MTDKNIIIKKVKCHKHEEGHGGSWKVAYADFVTAMMAFFLLLWLLNSAPSATLKGIAEYFKPTIGFPGSSSMLASKDNKDTPEGEKTDKLNQDSLNKISDEQRFGYFEKQLKQSLLDDKGSKEYSEHIEIARTSKGLVINIVDKKGKPTFKPGTATLEPFAKKILDKIIDIIKDSSNFIIISGHTDKTHSNPLIPYSNWELSADRANSTRRYAIRHGLSPEKVSSVIAYAGKDPLYKSNPYAPENRRVSITLLKDSQMPSDMLPAPDDILQEGK